MSTAEIEQDTAQESQWNKLSTLIFVVPYAVALAVAVRIQTLLEEGRRWTDIQAELLGNGVEADLLWTTAVGTLALWGMIAMAATLIDAFRAKPLQPVAVFSYGQFLFATVMMTSLSIVTMLDWVKANESELSVNVRLAIGIFGLALFAALIHLVFRKPVARTTAFYLGAMATLSFAALATATYGI